MRTVGVRELRNQIGSIVGAEEPVIIERYGHPVGVYLPLRPASKAEAQAAARNIERLMQEIAQENGMTPIELADEVERLAAEEDPDS